MKNLLSYCGLIDAKISASDKDLPVCTQLGQKVIKFEFEYPFEFNDVAVESLTLYTISKEFWLHYIIFKLN